MTDLTHLRQIAMTQHGTAAGATLTKAIAEIAILREFREDIITIAGNLIITIAGNPSELSDKLTQLQTKEQGDLCKEK